MSMSDVIKNIEHDAFEKCMNPPIDDSEMRENMLIPMYRGM